MALQDQRPHPQSWSRGRQRSLAWYCVNISHNEWGRVLVNTLFLSKQTNKLPPSLAVLWPLKQCSLCRISAKQKKKLYAYPCSTHVSLYPPRPHGQSTDGKTRPYTDAHLLSLMSLPRQSTWGGQGVKQWGQRKKYSGKCCRFKRQHFKQM